jgi:hypothetical protein
MYFEVFFYDYLHPYLRFGIMDMMMPSLKLCSSLSFETSLTQYAMLSSLFLLYFVFAGLLLANVRLYLLLNVYAL